MWLMPNGRGSENKESKQTFSRWEKVFSLRRKGKRKEEEHELDRQIICSGKAYLDGYLEQPL